MSSCDECPNCDVSVDDGSSISDLIMSSPRDAIKDRTRSRTPPSPAKNLSRGGFPSVPRIKSATAFARAHTRPSMLTWHWTVLQSEANSEQLDDSASSFLFARLESGPETPPSRSVASPSELFVVRLTVYKRRALSGLDGSSISHDTPGDCPSTGICDSSGSTTDT